MTVESVPPDDETFAIANAAINARVGAVDYGGNGPRFIVVRALARKPARPLAVRLRYPRSFAAHLEIETLLDGPQTAAGLIELTAAALASASPSHGIDLARMAADVRAARQDLPLAVPLAEVERANEVRFVDFDEARRRRLRRPLTRRLARARAFCTPELTELVGDDRTALAEVFGNVLRREGLQTPEYIEIYVNLATSLDDAKRLSTAVEDWHENAYAVLDADRYRASSATARIALLIDAYREALLRLADVDGLDRAVIERATEIVRVDGLDTELWGPSDTNDDYTARVVYRVLPRALTARFSLVVIDNHTQARREHPLGTDDIWFWPYRFGKVTLTRKAVRIDARRGVGADVHLEDAPRRIEVDLATLFRGAP